MKELIKDIDYCEHKQLDEYGECLACGDELPNKEDEIFCEGCGEELQEEQSIIKGENRHAVCS